MVGKFLEPIQVIESIITHIQGLKLTKRIRLGIFKVKNTNVSTFSL